MVGILGAADLANNIASATKGLAVAFGLANPEPQFPEFPDQGITAQFQREHWYKNPSQGLYSFSVEPVGKGSVSEFPAFVENIKSLFTGFFDKDGKFGEFKLPITPQEITQTEDFAVSIKPTQGGTVVNHSGNKYKTLSISGTTGVAPFRGNLGVFKGTGNSIGQPDDLQFRSGYEVFQHFRMWMRSYHETKAQKGKEDLRMMFRNYKDWEFLYVEPIKFTMKRDANKPLLYNYAIQFRVIGVFTIEKPLFDLVISKLNEVSAAAVNAYALIKKNKAVTETITGVIGDFEESMNNLKLAIKAANSDDVKLADINKSVVQKLSYKETLQVLGAFGTAMVKGGADTKTAEQNGTSPAAKDPNADGLSLVGLMANPGTTDMSSLKSRLGDLLDNETALGNSLKIDVLPKQVQNEIIQSQIDNALISRTEVGNIQDKAQALEDKLADGVGLGDDTYNQLFSITPTTVLDGQGEVTDDQFEMLYALSQSVQVCDGLLSSDEMFDKNSQTFSKADANNGANSIGQGIFSFPNPSTGVKEGFLPDNVTLEDLALSELGDSSRWTEISELNGLKAPYIIKANDTLGPNYIIQSENFSNPTQMKDLQIGYIFQIPGLPTPTGAWTGKSDYLAEYEGGDKTLASSWRFIFPDDGTLIKSIGTGNYIKFEDGEWQSVDPTQFTTDGVLKAGDKIKIPTTRTPPLATKSQGPRDNPFTNVLSNAEKSLAVDLKLNDQMDLDLTPSGDLNVATGYINGAQAIVLKLLYNKGSLKKFPSIGTNLSPGKKMPDIATLRTDLTSSLLQDNRIKNVSKINLIQQNSALYLTFEVIFNDLQQPVPVTIPV